MRIQAEFVEGFGALVELGAALARDGFAVVAGGGPGAMEAANKGALEAGGTAVGLSIELSFETGLAPYVNLGVHFRYVFVRKTVCVKYAQVRHRADRRGEHVGRDVRGAHPSCRPAR